MQHSINLKSTPNACGPARDQRKVILPDAKIDSAKASTPSATFEMAVDGAKADLAWTFGSPAHEPISKIAIFDTHCAQAYIDNHGDFAYRPYGLTSWKVSRPFAASSGGMATYDTRVFLTGSYLAVQHIACRKPLVSFALVPLCIAPSYEYR